MSTTVKEICPDCGANCEPGSMHQCPYRGLVQVPDPAPADERPETHRPVSLKEAGEIAQRNLERAERIRNDAAQAESSSPPQTLGGEMPASAPEEDEYVKMFYTDTPQRLAASTMPTEVMCAITRCRAAMHDNGLRGTIDQVIVWLADENARLVEALEEILCYAEGYDNKPHQLFSALRRAAVFEPDAVSRARIVENMDKAYGNTGEVAKLREALEQEKQLAANQHVTLDRQWSEMTELREALKEKERELAAEQWQCRRIADILATTNGDYFKLKEEASRLAIEFAALQSSAARQQEELDKHVAALGKFQETIGLLRGNLRDYMQDAMEAAIASWRKHGSVNYASIIEQVEADHA